MPEAPCADPVADATTATAATLARLRRRWQRSVIFMVVLCVAIAALLSVFERGAFGPHLVYSFAIGLSCWSLVSGSRLLFAWLNDRVRFWRGLPASAAGFTTGWRGIVPAVLVAMAAGPLLGMRVADALTGNTSPSLFNFDTTNTRVTLAFTVIGSVISVFVLSLMERLSSARAQAEAAQRLAAENQLRLLQSQLEPHMLFNTLANVRVLIGLDPPRAQAMLDRMIAFLRATLNASRVSMHPLAAEFERLADYLALMAVRMGDRLQVQLDLPEALKALAVPPLLLQPLVENAIKHGLEPKVDGGRIEVRAQRDGDMLTLTVRDTGVGPGPANAGPEGGFGLGQVRERLATLYGSRGSVALAAAAEIDAAGGTLVTVRLPIL
jgi:signal transduction histidine kinase